MYRAAARSYYGSVIEAKALGLELGVGVFLDLALNAVHTELSAGVEHKLANTWIVA